MKILILLAVLLAAGALLLLRRRSAFFAYHSGGGRVRVIRDVGYVRGSENPKHRLDLYLPVGVTEPLMVCFVHGGSWNSGDKDYLQWLTGLYGNVGVTLAKQGIGVAVLNYRLHPETDIAGMLDDVARGANFVIDEAPRYGWQKDVHLVGHSAGGHLITLAMSEHTLPTRIRLHRERVAGIIALSPVLDVPAMTASSKEGYRERVIYPVFGRTRVEQERGSPATYWASIRVPVAVLVGANDYDHIRDRGVALAGALVLPRYTHVDPVVRIGGSDDRVTPEVLRRLGRR